MKSSDIKKYRLSVAWAKYEYRISFIASYFRYSRSTMFTKTPKKNITQISNHSTILVIIGIKKLSSKNRGKKVLVGASIHCPLLT